MDPGTVFAVVSLSFQVFGGCVKGFVLLSNAHNLGKDASLLRTMLSLEEYRFIQWARAVGLLSDNEDDSNKNQPAINGSTLEAGVNPRLNQALASELMAQLESLLTTDQLRKRYKLEFSNLPDSSPSTSASARVVGVDNSENSGVILQKLVPDALRQRVLARAKLIQDENHFLQRLRWAAVDKKSFERMVSDVRALVDGLWALLDPLQRTDSSTLMRDVLARVIQISEDVGELRALQRQTSEETVTETPGNNNDNILSIAAGIKLTRIEINHSDLAEKAVAHGNKPQTPPQNATMMLGSPNLNRNLLTNVVTSSSNARTACGTYSNEPVWLEYKDVPRRMKGKLVSRVKNLAFLLAQPKHPSFQTLQCVGFLEEEESFVFVYRYPIPSTLSSSNGDLTSISSSNSRDEVDLTQAAGQKKEDQQHHPSLKSLNQLIRENKTVKSPSVTIRLAIARQICTTLLTLHTAGWLHKDMRSENVMFFGNNNWLQPYITGFSFSRQDSPTEISEQPSSEPGVDIYRHPHALGEPSTSFQKHMDLYSLGLILVELAEWKALKQIIKDCVDVRKATDNTHIPLNEITKVPKWLIDNESSNGQIRYRMGDVYAEIVHVCLKFGLVAEDAAPDTLPDLLDIVRQLEDCRI